MVSWFDIIVLIPLGFGAIMGFRKGFIIEATSILALLFGIYGAIGFSGFMESYLTEQTASVSKLIPVISFVLTFILIVAAVYFIGKLLEGVVKVVALGIVNRIAGALFGTLKLSLIISGIIFIVNSLDSAQHVFSKDLREKSFLYSPLDNIAPKIFPSIKELFKDNPIEKAVSRTSEALDETYSRELNE